VIITASGGPFRKFTKEQLKTVTLEDALAHPTWKMGGKISVDSATMANKGLEVIEAAALFDLPPERIKVVVHPQSIVHGMVLLKNGQIYAQLSKPDMRFPIEEALIELVDKKDFVLTDWGDLDFSDLMLSFEAPDGDKFPMLPLAYEALKRGGLWPVVYNAANEAAVNAFMAGRLGFPEIAEKVRSTMETFRADEAAELSPEAMPLAWVQQALACDERVRKACSW
jgi:1-deoxy-D-xylulose-5-phosphate reductoisomerase